MTGGHFVFGYLPFWIVNYGLALIMWCCVGRFLMSFFAQRIPTNYIWRSFSALTEWAVTATGWITPRFVHPIFLPLLAFGWLFYLRMIAFFVMWQMGLTPSITPPGGA
jgi:hypothetical protein